MRISAQMVEVGMQIERFHHWPIVTAVRVAPHPLLACNCVYITHEQDGKSATVGYIPDAPVNVRKGE